MIGHLLLLLGAGQALAGGAIQTPYLTPAGTTFAQHSFAVHGAGLRSSVAYGNGAFLGFGARLAPVTHAVAPVAAVVPTVHHVPGVAQVPVTKYEAQPAVIQNVVDVAKTNVATRKFEIRRPAIQKEFYDVEERVVVRPAGSAVVELDQPVSKSQRGPTVVQPAVHAVTPTPLAYAASYQAAPVNFRSFHVAPGYVHSYPIQGPHHIHLDSASTPAPHQELLPQHQPQPEYQQPQPQPEYPQQPQPQPEYPQQPQPQPEYPQQPQPDYQLQPQPEYPQQPQPQPELTQQPQPQFPQPQPQPEFPPQQPQSDDSDSVSIDNPELARARNQFPTPPQDQISRFIPQQLNRVLARSQQQAIQQQQLIVRAQTQAQEQLLSRLRSQVAEQEQLLARSHQQAQAQEQLLARSQAQERQLLEMARREEFSQQSVRSQNIERPAPRFQINAGLDDIRRQPLPSSRSGDVIPSFRLSPEESLTNQERLIALLTARGGVAEVRGPSERPAVRTRVLSVTPAPDNIAPREEKVNTRRIVVNKPIQTVEQVDVVEPFTKIERVAVHQPALIKTARVGVAHVPTTVPVHGYAHAQPTFAF